MVGIALVNDQDEVMLVTDRGQTIRTSVGEIRLTGRNAQGVRVMNVEADERVVAIERLSERDDEDDVVKATADGGADGSNGLAHADAVDDVAVDDAVADEETEGGSDEDADTDAESDSDDPEPGEGGDSE